MGVISRAPKRAVPRAGDGGSWHSALRLAIRDGSDLAAALAVDPERAAALGTDGAREAERRFPLRVPRQLVGRIARDTSGALLRQFAPAAEETLAVEGRSRDPLGEAAASPVPGILHKYRGRVLLIVTGACPVHCRYCFRRHFPYGDHALGEEAIDRALDYLRADPSIREVILSGGDPLSLDDTALAALERKLSVIPHLRRLRIHTRWPIVEPSRVDEALLEWLGRSRLRPIVVVHCNHAAEIDDAVRRALGALRERGVTLLNQSVLLRGVNDSADVLCALSEALDEANVLPYYLHLLDPVEGAAHFEVGDAEARRLLREVASRLPGYLVPRLAREEVGRRAKTVVAPAAWAEDSSAR